MYALYRNIKFKDCREIDPTIDNHANEEQIRVLNENMETVISTEDGEQLTVAQCIEHLSCYGLLSIATITNLVMDIAKLG